jgi:hypothetical protein
VYYLSATEEALCPTDLQNDQYAQGHKSIPENKLFSELILQYVSGDSPPGIRFEKFHVIERYNAIQKLFHHFDILR